MPRRLNVPLYAEIMKITNSIASNVRAKADVFLPARVRLGFCQCGNPWTVVESATADRASILARNLAVLLDRVYVATLAVATSRRIYGRYDHMHWMQPVT